MTNSKNTSRFKELSYALRAIKRYFIYAGLFSAAVNILMLAPIIYMLTVYNQVMGGGSLSTLAMLTLLLVCLLCALNLVRIFDVGGHTEGCVADDEYAVFYAAEEAVGIWKYGAEPGESHRNRRSGCEGP